MVNRLQCVPALLTFQDTAHIQFDPGSLAPRKWRHSRRTTLIPLQMCPSLTTTAPTTPLPVGRTTVGGRRVRRSATKTNCIHPQCTSAQKRYPNHAAQLHVYAVPRCILFVQALCVCAAHVAMFANKSTAERAATYARLAWLGPQLD